MSSINNYGYEPNSSQIIYQNLDSTDQQSLKNLIAELTMEVRALKTEVKELKKINLLKLTEEVIAVKLENWGKPSESQSPQFDQLPFYHKKDLDDFEAQLLQKPELLEKFKLYIKKTGGEASTPFLRAAIRRIFSHELAMSFSWRGTADKPSAEKCFVTTIIKNICHEMFQVDEKAVRSTLQKHFVYAKERVKERRIPLSENK
uniref:Alpha-glucan water dikinase, chloroplastic n=1 Tax=Zeugodacus cucurbitae TaxID=28588 RepID=A0A0A1X2D5_ZEUCU